MLLNAQATMKRLYAEIVHADIVARGDGSNAIEDATGMLLAGNRVDYHVCSRQCSLHRLSGGAHEFAGMFECAAARKGEGESAK